MQPLTRSLAGRSRRRLIGILLWAVLAALPVSAGLVSLVPAGPAAADGTVWYVNGSTGSDDNPCTDPSQPCQTVEAALQLDADSGTGGTIDVAPGTYFVQQYIYWSTNIVGMGSDPSQVVFDEAVNGQQPDAPALYIENSLGGAGPTVTISNLTITGSTDSAIANMGANVTLDNDEISKNGSYDSSGDESSYSTEGAGGGILNYGDLTLNTTVVSNNYANSYGGGIANFYGGDIDDNSGVLTLNDSYVSGNSAGLGGGLSVEGGSATVKESAVTDNSATHYFADGGGIVAAGASLQVTNSTIAGNVSNLWGGGIDLEDTTASLVNDTISDNSTTGESFESPNIYGGGLSLSDQTGPSKVTVQNTILAGNEAPGNADCYGTLIDGGDNILGDDQGCGGLSNGANGDMVGTVADPVNPGLSALDNNGGPTPTMAITDQSPAFGTGNASACAGAGGGIDQRGVSRQVSVRGLCDIGAYDTGLLAPPAPTDVAAYSLDNTIGVSWNAPPGYLPAISYYDVTCNPGCGNQYESTPGQTYLDISGLTVGQAYSFQVQAVSNVGGAGPVSATSNTVGFAVPPGDVTDVVATVHGTTATISWSPPANDNGAGITEYDVLCPLATVTLNDPDGNPTTCSQYNPAARPGVLSPMATQVNLYNLPRGASIQFAVLAGNAVGSGYETEANLITVPLLPGQPSLALTPASDTGVSDSDGVTADSRPTLVGSADAGAIVTIVDDGITTIGTATAGATGQWSFTPTTALANGNHQITAAVTDSAGTSTSAPVAVEIDASAPSAPVVQAAAGAGTATVTWSAASDAVAPITGYVVTAAPGGAQQTVSGSTLTATFSGLTDGTAYTFSVVATNLAGTRGAAATSAAVTPTAPPSAPLGVTATAGPSSLTASWTAPATDNGTPVTGYILTATPVGGGAPVVQTFDSAATTEVLGGLAAGTAYDLTVTAVNAAGTGPSTAAGDDPVTTPTTPGVPTAVTAVAERGSVSLAWTAPTADGGEPVTGYRIIPTPSCPACTGLTTTATTDVVTGLHNGTRYTFSVEGVNGIGAGQASAPAGPVTPSKKAPVFTSAPTRTVVAGQGFNLAVTATDKPTITMSGSPPSWVALTVKHGKYRLTCVPPAGTTGGFAWTYTAVNKSGQATQTFTLVVTG